MKNSQPMINRKQYKKLWEFLNKEKSMVFIVGPRQVGKTHLAKNISENFTNRLYFNWDDLKDQKKLLENPYFFEEIERKDSSKPLIIFDEIHKYKNWKNYLKGVFDKFSNEYNFIISGSGRLDTYQKGGDSLVGRYLIFHLFPFTISEFFSSKKEIKNFFKNPFEININNKSFSTLDRLSKLSGFPEPFLSEKKPSYRRWKKIYSKQLIREDIRNLTTIKEINLIETLFFLLPSKVSSPISITSLSKSLKTSYNTIKNWLDILEKFFLIFSIPPWTKKIKRAILKERKIYLFDFAEIEQEGAKFENMVALELKKAITNWTDRGLGYFSLHFLKNKDGEEVDFLIAESNKPKLLIEAKKSDDKPSVALKKFQTALNIPAIQLINKNDNSFKILTNKKNKILITPAHLWLSKLP